MSAVSWTKLSIPEPLIVDLRYLLMYLFSKKLCRFIRRTSSCVIFLIFPKGFRSLLQVLSHLKLAAMFMFAAFFSPLDKPSKQTVYLPTDIEWYIFVVTFISLFGFRFVYESWLLPVVVLSSRQEAVATTATNGSPPKPPTLISCVRALVPFPMIRIES
jgi:hypothetical protein